MQNKSLKEALKVLYPGRTAQDRGWLWRMNLIKVRKICLLAYLDHCHKKGNPDTVIHVFMGLAFPPKEPRSPLQSEILAVTLHQNNNPIFVKYESLFELRSWSSLRAKFMESIDDPQCLCCGSRSDLQVDHIVPRSKRPDLALDPSNLQILCGTCNRDKSDKHSMDYVTGKERKVGPKRDLSQLSAKQIMEKCLIVQRDGIHTYLRNTKKGRAAFLVYWDELPVTAKQMFAKTLRLHLSEYDARRESRMMKG